MKSMIVYLSLLLFAVHANGQAPTWAADIAPILYDHCVTCHRSGGIGDFPLETWTDATIHADAISSATASRYMPPWRALPSYRHFKDENYLSEEEIQTISDWVNGGQMSGDLSQAPPLPNFQNGSQLTSVDMVLETPEFQVFQDADIYRAFVIPTGVASDKFFHEVEFLPGNDEIIHHIVVYTDPTNEPVLRDEADPGPGFSTNGMVGNITENAELIAEWTPGGTPIKMPANFGYRIPANGYFIVEIHFAPEHIYETDYGSIVNLRLNTGTPRELYYGALTYAANNFGLLNPPFIIPANTVHTLQSEMSISQLAPIPLSLFTLTPHAHVFGKSFKAYAYAPGTTDTIPLIDIPVWDFYWQSTYTLQQPIKLGTNLITHADVTYDNTVNNIQQPFSPPQDVYWGEQTTDEMLFLFATVAVYYPGDEDIILDSTLLMTSVPELVPPDVPFVIQNPINEVLDIRATAPLTGLADLVLLDMNGKIIRQWREQNLSHSRTSVAHLTPGVYVLQIRQQGQISSFNLVKG